MAALKEEGNKLFASGSFSEAIEKYSEALEFRDAHEEPQAESDGISATLLYNRGCAYFRIGKFTECVADCSAAIQENPMYLKAIFRRALAYEQLEELEAALGDAKKVSEIDPSMAHTENIVRIEKKAAAKFEKDKNEMMSSLKELGNKILGNFGMTTDDFKFEKDPNTGSYSLSRTNQ